MATTSSSVTEAAQPATLLPQLGALPAAEIEERQPPTSALAAVLEAHGWSRVRFAVDCTLVLMCVLTAFLVRPGQYVGTRTLLLAAFALVAVATVYGRRSEERLLGSAIDTTLDTLTGASVALVVVLTGASLAGVAHPVALTLPLWLLASVYLCAGRLVLLLVRRRAISTGALTKPTLVVGAGTIGAQVIARLTADYRYGLHPVGLLDADPLPAAPGSDGPRVPVIGRPEDLLAAIAHTGARHVIFAFSGERDHVLAEQVSACHDLRVGVSVVPRIYEGINERTLVDHIGGLPVLALQPTNPRSWQFAVKHMLDWVLACIGLVALTPVLLLIGAVVRLTSPGPVLFRQRRIGRDGREFDVLKFRTMRPPTVSEAFEPPTGCAPGGIEGEDRRTAIGHFLRATSLDELPQLLNVLRGDMSLVGPRPERPEFVERFARDVASYERRHRVKSGITGWAQVNGFRGQTSIADRVEWDNYYIENWSLGLDLRILAMTVTAVFRLDGDT